MKHFVRASADLTQQAENFHYVCSRLNVQKRTSVGISVGFSALVGVGGRLVASIEQDVIKACFTLVEDVNGTVWATERTDRNVTHLQI